MIALAPALLFAGAQAATAPEPYRDAVDLFRRICTEGGGSFAAGSIETIPVIDVAIVREAVGQQRYNRFYRVSQDRWQAYLSLQDTIAEGDPRNLRHCAVAARGVDFGEAVTGIFPGSKPPRGSRRGSGAIYMHQSPQGHRVNIERLRGGYVLLTAIVPGPEAFRDGEILAAFRDACDRPHGRYAVAAKAEQLGWEEIPGSAHPYLPRLIGAAAERGQGLNARAFRRMIGDRPVFALVEETAEGSAGAGSRCRVYDFDATGPVDPKMIERWTRSTAANPRELLLEGGIERLLRPDWDKNASLELLHVPANSALAQQYGFSGNLFAASAVGDP